MKNTIKNAYTILEVTIATAIFVVVVTMVMESMTAMRGYIGHDESVYSLDMEARRVLRIMSQDLSTSAWYLPMDVDQKFDLLDPGNDRDLRYYPYILTQSRAGMGNLFDHFERPDDEVVTADDFPRGWGVPDSHMLPSQEMIFLKISRGVIVDDPEELRIPRVNYNNTNATPFSDFWNGPVVNNMRLVLDGDTISDIGIYFEADTSDRLREYSYIVRPNPRTGDRELIKSYAHRTDNGQAKSTAAIQEVAVPISRYVDRVVFDTYRTHPSLDVDQLRVEIYLSRRNDVGNVNFHKATMIMAMRSTVDPQYSEHIDSWLGKSGEYPVAY